MTDSIPLAGGALPATVDHRSVEPISTPAAPVPASKNTPQLRDYQQEGVNEIRAQFARGINRVCFQLPTGGGKTITFAYIIAAAVAKGSRVLIIVHRIELIEQIAAGTLHVNVGKVFQLDEIAEAHRCMEENKAGGKIVVLT